MLDSLINFTLSFLPVAAGFMPATLYKLKYKSEISILYSFFLSVLVGLLWWWGLYSLEITQESLLMVMLLVMGTYLLLRVDDKEH